MQLISICIHKYKQEKVRKEMEDVKHNVIGWHSPWISLKVEHTPREKGGDVRGGEGGAARRVLETAKEKKKERKKQEKLIGILVSKTRHQQTAIATPTGYVQKHQL